MVGDPDTFRIEIIILMANKMGEPTAILAINSLDRYAGQPVTNYSKFRATFYQSIPILNIVSGFPIVGAVISGFGIADGAYIKSVSANGLVAIISLPPTNSGTNTSITQASTVSSASQPVSNSLNSQYSDVTPYSHNFTIQSPAALIYGYITKIIVSQIQLQYNIPTVNLGKNDTFYIADGNRARLPEQVVIPHGFYYADELAAALQVLIRATTIGALADITVVFVPRDGFIFTSNSAPPLTFYFPDIPELQLRPGVGGVVTPDTINNILKTYRLLGLTIANSYNVVPFTATTQVSFDYPTFLYTPYIDVYSDVLTNYQKIKDTNTSVQKPKGMVARIYVSGTGQIQTTGSVSALGTAPFVMTSDLNSPKVIRWEPNVAIPSIDFQLLDQYGEFIPGAADGFSTEFQMTLLCSEGE